MIGSHKILMILGMHRSGTSLFTNWLHDCGLHIGNRLLGAMESNPKGHFEDLDFMELQEKILVENHTDWIYKNRVDLNIKSEWVEYTQALIKSKNQANNQWGWKDPRTCLLLDFWEEIIPHVYKIVIFRDYKEVIQSLVKRELIPQQQKLSSFEKFKYKIKDIIGNGTANRYANLFLETWCIYNESLISKTANDPNVLFINIKDVAKYQQQILNHLSNNLGFSINTINFDDVFDSTLWRGKKNINFILDKDLENRAIILFRQLMNIQNDRFIS